MSICVHCFGDCTVAPNWHPSCSTRMKSWYKHLHSTPSREREKSQSANWNMKKELICFAILAMRSSIIVVAVLTTHHVASPEEFPALSNVSFTLYITSFLQLLKWVNVLQYLRHQKPANAIFCRIYDISLFKNVLQCTVNCSGVRMCAFSHRCWDPADCRVAGTLQ